MQLPPIPLAVPADPAAALPRERRLDAARSRRQARSYLVGYAPRRRASRFQIR